MKNIELKYRKWLRKIFGCISFTAVAFVFQACYGHVQDEFYDVKLTGTVTSKTTNLPIKGIKITVNNNMGLSMGFTDENGNFNFSATVPNPHFYRDSTLNSDSVNIYFLDIDGAENGYFEDKTIIINPDHRDEVKIYVELEDKQ